MSGWGSRLSTVDFEGGVIVIEDSHGSIDHPLKAHTVDAIGWGSGHTEEEAALSLVNSIRRTADDMEAKIKKKYSQ